MIIGTMGFIGSGKDTVANILVKDHGFTKIAFATPLKDTLCAIFHWDRELLEGYTSDSRAWRNEVDTWWSDKLEIPNFTPRMAMQLLGTDILRKKFNDRIWTLSLEKYLNENTGNNEHVVITDVRFFNEIQLVLKQGGKTLIVDSGNKPEWYDVAVRAYELNFGESIDGRAARVVMHDKYGDVHESEWAWVGHTQSIVINNRRSEVNVDKLANNVKTVINAFGY